MESKAHGRAETHRGNARSAALVAIGALRGAELASPPTERADSDLS